MKNHLNKILIITLIIFFNLSKSYSIENVTEFTDAINEAREKFNNASEASTEQSKIIDEAFKEIDKASEYVQEAINNNNAEDAIKTLEFIEKSLTDVESIIPKEFGSDMSNIDITAIPKEDMETITEITTEMKVAKEKKEKDFISDLVEINLKGIDTASISEKLDSLGVNTIKLDLVLNLDQKKKIEDWTKEEWAETYKGSILTSDGTEVITDKEISSKVTELENKFQENTFKINNKRIELTNLNKELNPINFKLESLNEQKSLLTAQYNLEISKLSAKNLSELETQKSIELSEKLKNQIEGITNEVLQAEQKSNSLNVEILSLNNSINEQIIVSNKLRDDINNLNQNKLELTDAIALQTAKLNELKGQSSKLSSSSDVSELKAKLEDSDKLKTELTDLQSQIESKNLLVSEKISKVDNLNNQLEPLSNKIKSLEEKREALQNQYNSEISNISNSFNNNELVKSQELAANFNNEINSISSEINSIEANSSQLKTDISQLNLEINSEKDLINKISFEITNSQKDLDRTLEIISSKEIQLDQLKNTDIVQVNQKLNEQLNQVSLQKDFIESQFEKSIDKEVEALERYWSALGNIDSEYFDEEVDFAIREVGVILDSDPRKAAAFEIEKWATYAGLSKEFIQQGINAVNNDDWDAQKQVFKDITIALAKNPDWQVDIPSKAELNVMIAEEKAVHEAVLTLNESRKVQEQVDKIISERTLQYQDDATIDLSKVSLAFTRLDGYGNPTAVVEGKEAKLVADQLNEILKDNQEFSQLQKSLEEKNDLLSKILEENKENDKKYGEILNQYNLEISKIQNEIQGINNEITKINIEKNEFLASINENDLTVAGGWAAIYRMRGSADHGKWVAKVSGLEKGVYTLNESIKAKQLEATNEYNKLGENLSNFKTSGDRWAVQSEINDLKAQTNKIQIEAAETARDNVVNLQKQAVEEINKVRNEEIAKTGGLYNTAEEVNKILDQIPTFDAAQRERVNEVLTGINASWGYQVNLGDKAAALRSALGQQSDYDAYLAAVKAMSEMGKAPVSEFMTGPYWEMSNVKAAAIVRSKKYDWVDDYEYINAYYRDPLQLNTSDRQYVEGELKNLLGNNNPKLNALTKQANALKAEIDTNNIELSNINNNISKLENEISSIKSSEENLKNQIAKLNNDLTSKQSIIDGKNKSLNDLQKNLDPISNKISELEAKKIDLNNNINNQIALISQNTKKSDEITQKTLELETKLNNELSQIDQQINGYKQETEKLTVNISSLNNEILNLEKEKPDLSNKISKINEELIGYSNVKAELSVLTADRKVEVENIGNEINKLESELSNLKNSESQINQQLASLSNELKSKEDIIKSNNVSISEIQKQIDPLNSQIEALENQKVSLNEQFNKDFTELSNQIEQTTEAKSADIDKLKGDFEIQISKLNEEINNFESQANELNSTVITLNEEIKSIEVETPQLINKIAKLNQDIKNVTDIKANLAMATAKNIGIKVDEKAIKSLGKLEGKAIISIKGTELVRVVDEKMLVAQAEQFIDPISSFSLNTKIYNAEAIKTEVFIVEEITNTYSKAKAERIVARENLAAIESSPESTKEEIQAAEAEVYKAKLSEIAAGQSLVSNNAMATAITTPQQTLDNLRAIRNTPGADKWSVRRTEAAIKALEAKIAGKSYNYEQALNKISNDEQKFNEWRVDSYKKSIEAAKASGNKADLEAYTRRLENFQNRLVDQQKAVVEIQAQQSNYNKVLNNVAVKTAALTGISFQETTKVVTGQSSLPNEATSFSINDAKSMTQDEARTANYVKETARAANPTATLSADTNALRAAGASVEQATAYAAARSAKQAARQNWDAAMKSGDKAAQAAAEAAFMAAREAESVAGVAAANAAAQASVAAQAAKQAAQVAASTTEVAEAAAEAAQAAQEVTSQVAQAAQDASRDAQQAALDALWEVESAAKNTFDVFRATAAIRQLQAEMNNNEFDYKGAGSYEDAMKAIDEMEEKWNAGDKSAIIHGQDPNRIGKCGKSSC